MSREIVFGIPAHSSTPKLQDNRNFKERTQKTKMSIHDEVKRLNVNDGGKSVQKTVVEKTYFPSGNRSFANEQRISSSPQQRYGARPSNAGNRRGGVGRSFVGVSISYGFEVTPGLISSRAEEKAALERLNDRFVTYIEKVRHLVNRNQFLEAKLKQLEGCQIIPSRARDMYDAKLHDLQKKIKQVISDKTQVEIDQESCCRELDDCRKKLQDAENEVKFLCKDMDRATLVRVKLEGEIECLTEELDLVRRANKEDIRVLTEQLLALSSEDVVDDGPQPTDLFEALRDIRAAYEQLTQNNQFKSEEYYKSKIADLSKKVRDESSQGKNIKYELMDTRRQLQSITVQLKSTRTSKAILENQLDEIDTQNRNELAKCYGNIHILEQDLNKARDKVHRQLVEYEKLLNLNLSLDLEIQTYKKLLDGEENSICISGNAGKSSSGRHPENIVEKTVTDQSNYMDGNMDDDAIDVPKDDMEQERSEEIGNESNYMDGNMDDDAIDVPKDDMEQERSEEIGNESNYMDGNMDDDAIDVPKDDMEQERSEEIGNQSNYMDGNMDNDAIDVPKDDMEQERSEEIGNESNYMDGNMDDDAIDVPKDDMEQERSEEIGNESNYMDGNMDDDAIDVPKDDMEQERSEEIGNESNYMDGNMDDDAIDVPKDDMEQERSEEIGNQSNYMDGNMDDDTIDVPKDDMEQERSEEIGNESNYMDGNMDDDAIDVPKDDMEQERSEEIGNESNYIDGNMDDDAIDVPKDDMEQERSEEIGNESNYMDGNMDDDAIDVPKDDMEQERSEEIGNESNYIDGNMDDDAIDVPKDDMEQERSEEIGIKDKESKRDSSGSSSSSLSSSSSDSESEI